MTRPGIFGWSYPPGVTGREPEITGEWGPCECCGCDPADCLCPECPVCGEQGNPACYLVQGGEKNHNLEYNTEQLIGQCKMRIADMKENLRYEELALIQLTELFEQEKASAEQGQGGVGASGSEDGTSER